MNDETFHASHPFLFYIEDESSGTILYMGVVNDPLEASGQAEPPRAPALMPPRLGNELPPAADGKRFHKLPRPELPSPRTI